MRSPGGRNNRGQIGDGTTVDRLRPVRVPGLPLPATRISAGDSHSGVVLSDGSVWMWGLNANGQLGDGTRINRLRPVRAQFTGQAVVVEAGFDHTLASHTDQTVFAWGDNSEGQLGDGTTTDRQIPARVPGLTNVIQISAGAFHNIVRRSPAPRTAFAWGRNTDGQVGNGTRTSPVTSPVQVAGLMNVASVSAGAFHSLARELDGPTPIRAWGSNSDGQLGDGTRTGRLRPVVVPTITSTLVDISAGGFHSVTTVILT
jgi:alpha-tubulin suppressor-like RCC1 family protein